MSSKSSEIKERKLYWPSGELQVICFYKDDELHGEYKWFYTNGQVGRHCFFKDGVMHGEYKLLDKAGEIERHIFIIHRDFEEISEYIEDINNITDDEFMNLSMVFGENFIASTPQNETAS